MIDIEALFTYHTPKPEQQPKYAVIRTKAKELAYIIEQLAPDSPERDIAIRRLHECSMLANAAIAIYT